MLNLLLSLDDSKLLMLIRQLQGILEILGSRVSKLLRIPSHTNRILRSFIVLLTFDYSSSDILRERIDAESKALFIDHLLMLSSYVATEWSE